MERLMGRYFRGVVLKRPILRRNFWEDHAHELHLYAEGKLVEVERPVASYSAAQRRKKS